MAKVCKRSLARVEFRWRGPGNRPLGLAVESHLLELVNQPRPDSSGEGRVRQMASGSVATPPLRAAVYARVSTSDQSSEPQTRELREYAGRRGWRLVESYVDVASGAAETRPQLSRMMCDAHRHEFDVLLVWRFDRFGRSLRHLLLAIDELHALGIEFCSYSEAIDTSTPQGRLLFSLLGAFAEFERELIRERVKLGQRAAKLRGVWIARRPDRLDEVRILADYEALKSTRQVALLHQTSPRTVRRIVHGERAQAARERGIIPLARP